MVWTNTDNKCVGKRSKMIVDAQWERREERLKRMDSIKDNLGKKGLSDEEELPGCDGHQLCHQIKGGERFIAGLLS